VTTAHLAWQRRKQLITALFAGGIILLMGLAVAAVIFGARTQALNARLAQIHAEQEEAHALLQAVVDAETGVRGYVVTANPDYLQPYYAGIDRTQHLLLQNYEHVWMQAVSPDGRKLIDVLREREGLLAQLIQLVQEQGSAAAGQALSHGKGKRVMDELRATIGRASAELEAEGGVLGARAQSSAILLSGLLLFCLALAMLLSLAQFMLFRREIVRRGAVEADLQARHKQIALISQLADSLHSSNSREESYAVIRAFAADILEGASGCLYVYNNSRDQLHRAAQWGLDCINPGLAEHFTPDECWGLRRGKINVVSSIEGHVQCRHVQTDHGFSYMCIPITARGQTSGLLYLQTADPRGEAALAHVQPLARGFADQLSLALVNIELRERLQNMAIKDPLTELYNRRFLDEALSRELLVAERKKSKVSLALIDIDHFKKVNDTYGHPAGDAILKQVARYLAGSMRRSDIVCRYGGEEMLVVMPDCDLDEAAKKLQALRQGIKQLVLRSDGVEIPSVTVSIGLAAYPSHATDRVDLVAAADQALYQAKHGGRDRVVVAEHRDQNTIAAS
jgi:diguanylate cyclase (GGDEF)-like protein